MGRIEETAVPAIVRLVSTAAVGIWSAFGLTGCCYYELRDAIDDCAFEVRGAYLARRAWHRCGDGDHPYAGAYKDGFIDGYSAVAGGEDGCPPTMPPRSYWGVCNAGCEGQARVNAYFDGFARGAVEAEADGAGVGTRVGYHRPTCEGVCHVSDAASGLLVPAPAETPPVLAPPGITRVAPVAPPLPASPSDVSASSDGESFKGDDASNLYE